MTRAAAEVMEDCLIGTPLGDALGLPYENLGARRASKLLGRPDRFRLVGRRGMVSDDTEHAVVTLVALTESRGDPAAFAQRLARRLRGWMLSLPIGAGAATVKRIVKTMVGVSPARSGAWSAGNGPCMRAAVIGLSVSPTDRLRFVEASTVITHRDPKAVIAAFAVATAAGPVE